jgi:hypothetical protein
MNVKREFYRDYGRLNCESTGADTGRRERLVFTGNAWGFGNGEMVRVVFQAGSVTGRVTQL